MALVDISSLIGIMCLLNENDNILSRVPYEGKALLHTFRKLSHCYLNFDTVAL